MPRIAPALILALAAVLPAAAATAGKPAFSPLDVFALEWASDPEISPDGARVAYVRRSRGFGIRVQQSQACRAVRVVHTGCQEIRRALARLHL